jgi:tetratricopeptide (TPR) repeat protein
MVEACPGLAEREEGATIEQSIDLHGRLRGALLAFGEAGKGFDHLRDAERLARRVDDRPRLGFVLAATCHHYFLGSSPVETRRFGHEALDIANALGNVPLQVVVNFYLGQAHLIWGEARPARDFLRKVVGLLEGGVAATNIELGLAGLSPAVAARAEIATALANLGDFQEAAQYADEALSTAEVLQQPYSTALAYGFVAWSHLLKGDFQRATSLAERALVAARDPASPFLIAGILPILARGYLFSGRAPEGVSLLCQVLQQQEAMGIRWNMSMIVVSLAEAYLVTEQIPAAFSHATRALDLAAGCGDRGNHAWSLQLLGDIYSHPERRDTDVAEGYYRKALALADELGLRPLVAHCHLGLGKLYWRTGEREQAREYLTTATTMYREMGMTYWLEQAGEEMGNLG